MSSSPSEVSARKRRNESQGDSSAAKASIDGDHRKKRRNRTTQSCLNCHTSKRMCDRKRPACARCTQLGLTGLCVYEVDDPNQRTDAQDETTRLISRVAELETVIRELKNKPHPRWLQSGPQLLGETSPDAWVHQSHYRVASEGSPLSGSPLPSSPAGSDDHRDRSPFQQAHLPPNPRSIMKGATGYPPVAGGEIQSQAHSPFCQSPQSSTPSPLLRTPVDEYSRLSYDGMAVGMPSDYDLSAMLLSYPSIMGSDESRGISKNATDEQAYRALTEPYYCGCAEETSAYNVLLELSLRLRKSADTLSRIPRHHQPGPGNDCTLHRRISELDRYVSTLLGNVIPALDHRQNHTNDVSQPFVSQGYGPSSPLGPLSPSCSPISSLVNGVSSWEISQHPSPPSREAFMRWGSPTRS